MSNSDDPPTVSGSTDPLQLTLCRCAADGDLEGVQKAVAEGADPTVLCEIENVLTTALHVACSNGKLEIAKWLVQHGKVKDDLLILEGESQRVLDAYVNANDKSQDRTQNLHFTEEYGGCTPLHLSCIGGSLPIVSWLVKERKVSINQQDFFGETPLYSAWRSGQLDVVSWILVEECKEEIDLSLVNHNGYSPFHAACKEGHLDIVKALYAFGDINVNALFCNTYRATPLWHAAIEGKLDVVKWLVKKTNASVKICCKDGYSPLHAACFSGHLQICNWLVAEANASVDQKNTKGRTALMSACALGKLQVAKWLSDEMGLNVNHQSSDGETACEMAAARGQLDIVRWLVKEKNASDELASCSEGGFIMRPLTAAAENGHTDVIKWLLRHGNSPVEGWETNGYTPLRSAILFGHLDAAKALVEGGADINQTNEDGKTLLHMACIEGFFDIIQWLVGFDDIDANGVDNYGQTPLFDACAFGQVAIAKWLLESANAIVDRAADGGTTPFCSATRMGHLDVMKVLVQSGNANVNFSDNDGNTALLHACRLGDTSMIKWLLGPANASIKKRNKAGLTAYDVAKITGGDVERAFNQHLTKVQQCWDLVGYLANKEWFSNASHHIQGGRKRRLVSGA